MSDSESRSTDLLALRIRNLIATREANTAEANRELQSGDGWLWDHGQRDRELEAEIDELFKQPLRESEGLTMANCEKTIRCPEEHCMDEGCKRFAAQSSIPSTLLLASLPILDEALNYFYPERACDPPAALAARMALFTLRDRIRDYVKANNVHNTTSQEGAKPTPENTGENNEK